MADKPNEIVEVVGPVRPRVLNHIVSTRLPTELIDDLRALAEVRGVTVSDLLRVGAEMAIADDGAAIERQRLVTQMIGRQRRLSGLLAEMAGHLQQMAMVQAEQALLVERNEGFAAPAPSAADEKALLVDEDEIRADERRKIVALATDPNRYAEWVATVVEVTDEIARQHATRTEQQQ